MIGTDPNIGEVLLGQPLSFTTRTLAREEYLFHRGDPVEQLFIVREGRCRLERDTYDGRLLKLADFLPGELVAEGSLFHPTYGCDCRALSRTVCTGIPAKAVFRLLETDARLAQIWLTTLARQVMELRTRLELRNIRSARDRLLLYLQLNADAQGIYRHGETLKSLAETLGLTPESLYRTLASLEREGVVMRGNGMIRFMGGEVGSL
ncbi:MAG: Crp/Fnr family transcriptional regulator [Gammaproteobacteria bacterium]